MDSSLSQKGVAAKRVVEDADPYIMWLYLHRAAHIVEGGLPDAPFLRFATAPFSCCEQVCKPGSVLNGHLSRRGVAAALQPPPGDGRAGHVSPPRCCSG